MNLKELSKESMRASSELYKSVNDELKSDVVDMDDYIDNLEQRVEELEKENEELYERIGYGF